MQPIDINFDFQAEAGKTKNGAERDSDKFSPTLQEYHRRLWSKPLPNGETFELAKIRDNQLQHISHLGVHTVERLGGAVTLSGRGAVKKYLDQIDPDTLEEFLRLVVTIGARIVWPANRVDGHSTINRAKGMNYLIADRLDLTIECIRRYYQGMPSPLYETLVRYEPFFDLFVDFRGYIDFFLLQDYVDEHYQHVHIAAPFDEFRSSPIPTTASAYIEYAKATMNLIHARNQRIALECL